MRLRATTISIVAIFISSAALSACLVPRHSPSLTSPTVTLQPTAVYHPPKQTITPTASPLVVATPTEQPLTAWLDLPPRDLSKIAARLCGIEEATSHHLNAAALPREGDRRTFWLSTEADWSFSPISATLVCSTEHLQMWVQNGVAVDEMALRHAAEKFETLILPTNRRYFGTECTPGVDGDARIVVLNARFSGVMGYYSSIDEYSRRVHPYSNQCEIIYLNLNHLTPDSAAYNATMAHEYQHMIHLAMDANEAAWVNEGASKLAERLNGFAISSVMPFARDPDVQLNTWPEANYMPHYHASYLFMEYFLARFGTEALNTLIANDANGIAGFEKTLREYGEVTAEDYSFDALFMDWLVTNYLNDSAVANGRYSYAGTDIAVDIALRNSYNDYPALISDTVHQYGAHYIEFLTNKPALTISFTGSTEVSITANQPYSGQYHWWSNRGDMSDMTLTRAFDLRDVATATLQFALWYDIEEWWDWGYVEASTDGGRTWSTLAGQHTTAHNPYGSNLGHGYSGASGGWVNERVDLSPYAGHQIMLRFEHITDDAVNRPGLCVDDIAVPEIGYYDDAEESAAGWDAAGFLRTTNSLPQKFGVQFIEFYDNGSPPRVRRLQLDEMRRGEWEISGDSLKRVVVVIAGLTPITTERARYRMVVETQ